MDNIYDDEEDDDLDFSRLEFPSPDPTRTSSPVLRTNTSNAPWRRDVTRTPLRPLSARAIRSRSIFSTTDHTTASPSRPSTGRPSTSRSQDRPNEMGRTPTKRRVLAEMKPVEKEPVVNMPRKTTAAAARVKKDATTTTVKKTTTTTMTAVRKSARLSSAAAAKVADKGTTALVKETRHQPRDGESNVRGQNGETPIVPPKVDVVVHRKGDASSTIAPTQTNTNNHRNSGATATTASALMSKSIHQKGGATSTTAPMQTSKSLHRKDDATSTTAPTLTTKSIHQKDDATSIVHGHYDDTMTTDEGFSMVNTASLSSLKELSGKPSAKQPGIEKTVQDPPPKPSSSANNVTAPKPTNGERTAPAPAPPQTIQTQGKSTSQNKRKHDKVDTERPSSAIEETSRKKKQPRITITTPKPTPALPPTQPLIPEKLALLHCPDGRWKPAHTNHLLHLYYSQTNISTRSLPYAPSRTTIPPKAFYTNSPPLFQETEADGLKRADITTPPAKPPNPSIFSKIWTTTTNFLLPSSSSPTASTEKTSSNATHHENQKQYLTKVQKLAISQSPILSRLPPRCKALFDRIIILAHSDQALVLGESEMLTVSKFMKDIRTANRGYKNRCRTLVWWDRDRDPDGKGKVEGIGDSWTVRSQVVVQNGNANGLRTGLRTGCMVVLRDSKGLGVLDMEEEGEVFSTGYVAARLASGIMGERL